MRHKQAGQELVLHGGGSLALEVMSFVNDINRHAGEALWHVSHVIDKNGGRTEDLKRFWPDVVIVDNAQAIPERDTLQAVICVGDAAVRQRLYNEQQGAFAGWATIIHPTASISGKAMVGPGCIVAPNCYVGPFADVEPNSLLNVGACVGHDVVVGSGSVISPQAAMNGFSRCGEACFVGASASLLPDAAMGSYSKLSAGSVLKDKVGEGFLLHGNPATGRVMFRVPTTR